MTPVEAYTIKVRNGNYLYPMTVKLANERLYLKFGFNLAIKDHVKSLAGARWHPEQKEWSISNNSHNLFQLRFLAGDNPYARYDLPLVEFKPRRIRLDGELYPMAHQIEMSAHALTRQECEFACEMGTGKTLAMIEAMEASRILDWWWCGPRSALYSVKLEFRDWEVCDICGKVAREHHPFVDRGDGSCARCKLYRATKEMHPNHNHQCLLPLKPRFFTYESLKKEVEQWSSGRLPPRGVVFDECSRLKNPAAQRSQAAFNLAEEVRKIHGDGAWIVEMSGSPAPKDPCDWWHQCEVARPGFIKEGTIQKFKQRLAIIEERQSVTGGVYPHLVTWRDSESKCEQCGQEANSFKHDLASGGHTFKPSVNEVALLYKRMKGLVFVKFKKDCLGLPDKQYKVIELRPTAEMQRSATIINAKAPAAIQALTLLRELSDGFQYKEEELGTETCPICKGARVLEQVVDLDSPEATLDEQSITRGYRVFYDEAGMPIGQSETPLRLGKQNMACPTCSGTGETIRTARVTKEVNTPKEDALKELLDLHEEGGRIVIFAGFTGSVDRCVGIAKRQGWEWIRVDGRGWTSSIEGGPEQLLDRFQNDRTIEKLAFIGQPGAAGMGLNLTASPSIVYYSNDFNAESRIQSEDRIHRPGMDVNLGATIYDLICLPSDMLVLNNLKRKRRLQDLSLGQMAEEIRAIRFSEIRDF